MLLETLAAALQASDLSPAATPTLWRLAGQGSVGSLVDYAVLPLTCPADGWLTLNAGARAPRRPDQAASVLRSSISICRM